MEVFPQFLPDSVIIQKAKANARFFYDRTMEGSGHLYNGSEYKEYQPLVDEHPYYLMDDWALGEVTYEGEVFPDVPLLFDIHRGKLVVLNYSNGNKLQLVNALVDAFTLEGHRFINLKQTTDSITMKTGFYEKLYPRKTQVLARRQKEFNEKINGLELTQSFKETTQYYLETRGQFFQITSKRDMIETLANFKKELKSFIRQNKLFKKDREASIVQVAQYFDTLKP